jgi:serine O-acetyltransferase
LNNISYILRQLHNIVPADCSEESDAAILYSVMEEVDQRYEYLVSRVRILRRSGTAPDPLHVMKHPIYLYLLARVIFERNVKDDSRLKDRLYCLNKALHGCSLYFKVKMPAVFFLNYATQIVLGDCIYGENLVVYQGVTVGAYREKSPILGNNIVLMPNSIVSGATVLGNNIVVSAGVAVINQVVPDNTIVFGAAVRNSELAFHPLKDLSYVDYFLAL